MDSLFLILIDRNKFFPSDSTLLISLANYQPDNLDSQQNHNFQQIFDTNHKKVFNICLNMLQNTEDAEDITQEVFVQVFHSIDKFAEQSSMATWIYRIAVNKSLDFIKAKKRNKRFGLLTHLFHPETGDLLHEFPHFEHPGALLENKESSRILFSALNKIPDSQKTVFMLSKIEGFSNKEIAEIMSMSFKAVESLNQRAKENLKKLLGNYYQQRRN